MILQVEPVGSFERKRADVAEIEALAKLTREMEVQLDIYIRAAFERLVDLAGTREFLQPFCAFQQYLFAIKRKREEELAQPFHLEREWAVIGPSPMAVSMPTVVDPLFILDLLRMSYQQRPGQKPSNPVPVAPSAPVIRVATVAPDEDAPLETATQQVYVKFMKRTQSGSETIPVETTVTVPQTHLSGAASLATVGSAADNMDISEDNAAALNILEKAYVSCQAELMARIARGDYGRPNEAAATQPEPVANPAAPVIYAPILNMQVTTEPMPSPTKFSAFKPIVTAFDANPQQLPSPVSPAGTFELPAHTRIPSSFHETPMATLYSPVQPFADVK